MPQTTMKLRPGINSMASQTQAEGGWWACNLIRWRWTGAGAFLEKLGGWLRLFSTQCAGYVRAIHAYEDLSAVNNLLLGTDGGMQIYNGTALYTFLLARETVYYTDANNGNYGTVEISFTVTGVGATIVTVHDVHHQALVGDRVIFLCSFTAGGRRYPAGTVETVATVVDADTWTFTAAAATSAAGTAGAQMPAFYGGGTLDSSADAKIHVNWENHGFSVNDTFTVDQATILPNTWTAAVITSTYTLAPGGYTVTAVFSADRFTISATIDGAGITGWGAIYEGAYWVLPTLPSAYTLPYPFAVYEIEVPANQPNWFLDNLGEIGLINYTNSQIWTFTPPVPSYGVPVGANIPTAPQINSGMFVAMPQAQIIAFGSEVTIGSGVQDPLLLRWSDAGSYTDWTAADTNQAGSYRLSRGSRIVGGIQAPNATLIWTDIDVWQMSYIGPPLIYSFNIMATGCGLIAPKARASLGGRTVWMGKHGFWMFANGAVTQLPCDVYNIVFDNLDTDNQSKCFAAANSDFSEVAFYFPSLSGGTGEIDSYVKVNLGGQAPLWDYGSLVRTAWIDDNVFGAPLGADANFRIQQHEQGYDDDDVAMTGVYAESGFASLSDGSDIMHVSQMIPDYSWIGSLNGSVNVVLKTVNYPSDRPNRFGPYSTTNTTPYWPLSARARQVAVRFEWAAYLGFSARIGAPRFRIAPSGRKP